MPVRNKLWLPEGAHTDLNIEHSRGQGAGRFTGGGWKLCWHITVSPWNAVDSMVSVLKAKNAAPHFVIGGRPGYRFPVVVQMLPLNEAGRALAHPSGPETNRANTIQVEICARPGNAAGRSGDEPQTDLFDLPGVHVPASVLRAAEAGQVDVDLCMDGEESARTFNSGVAAWTDDTYKALANLALWVEHRLPIRRGHARLFTNTARFSGTGYVAAKGHLGHMHVPGNCVSADTPVLCADLLWRAAGDLRVGDELIGFDESAPDQQGRRLKRSTVTHMGLRTDALLRVHTSKGDVRCNREHPWLVRRGDKTKFGRNRWGSWQWIEAKDLQPGDQVCWVLQPWDVDRSWAAGWLAGMYDGEGSLCVSRQGGVALSLAQRESPTADRMVDAVRAIVNGGSEVRPLRRAPWGEGGTDMVQVTVGKRAAALHVLGSVRPPRLLEKADAVWEDASLGRLCERVEIESVEPWGAGAIAMLSTSTETYVAGGFAMHNTHYDPTTAFKGRTLLRYLSVAPNEL